VTSYTKIICLKQQGMVLELERQYKESNTSSIRNPIADEQRMTAAYQQGLVRYIPFRVCLDTDGWLAGKTSGF